MEYANCRAITIYEQQKYLLGFYGRGKKPIQREGRYVQVLKASDQESVWIQTVMPKSAKAPTHPNKSING
jgi:hypothetical protein